MAQFRQAHDLECNCKKCTAKVICRGCKETWQHKDLNYEGYCDECDRAHKRIARTVSEMETGGGDTTMACTTTRTNTAALAAYIEAQQQARVLLADVTAYLDGHQDCATPEEIHWGHVGDISAVITQLTRILEHT